MSKEDPSTQVELVIPLFPLPNTVFYPDTLLPLHIFEPRYREMTRDALDGDGKIGMVLLKPDYESEYFDRPGIHKIGCMGNIEKHVQLPDGKFNFTLKGMNRFEIIEEIKDKPYRRARVLIWKDVNDRNIEMGSDDLADALKKKFTRYCARLNELGVPGQSHDLQACKTLGGLVDVLAMDLDFPTEKKQYFLEERDADKRAQKLLDELNLKYDLISISYERNKTRSDPNWN